MASISSPSERVRAAINEVVDPCSIGQGVPAGLVEMGMLCGLELQDGPGGGLKVHATMRLTSPSCSFHLYLDQRLRDCLLSVEEVEDVEISWSKRFDWSDEDMLPGLKRRMRMRREQLLAAHTAGAARGTSAG